MSTDLDELKALVAAIKADQQAQRDKEKREGWTKYVSRSMIFLAVLAAIATQRGAAYSSATMKELNEATFNQAEASDQWAFYQAKGIKQSMYELERDRATGGALGLESKALAGLTTKIDRYDGEKKDIIKEAKSLESKRDLARARASAAAFEGRELSLATTSFQVAIAMGECASLLRNAGYGTSRWGWAHSLWCKC